MSNLTISSQKINAGNMSDLSKYHESEQNFNEDGQAIGSGADDYFSRPEETGEAAKFIGGFNPDLGTYEMGDYEKVMSGYDPRTGEDLLSPERRALINKDLEAEKPRQVLGYSTTFNLSKSISLLYASGSPEEQAAIEKAAMTANKEVWKYAENNGIITTRTGKEGVNKHAAEMLGMSFLHITSRNLDPQLHIHNEIANYVKFTDENGVTRTNTLNAADIYNRQKELAALFDIALRDNLKKELDIKPEDNYLYADFADKDKGLKVNGITKEACDKYSSRRAEIVKALQESGNVGNADAGRNAALNTRNDKTETDINQVKEEWREELKNEKPEALADAFKSPSKLAVEDELFKGRSVFKDQDLDRTAAQLALAAGGSLDNVKAWKEKISEELEVINLGNGHYSTADMLKLESEIVRFSIRAARPSATYESFEIPDDTVNNALKEAQESKGFKLRDEQTDALKHAVLNNQFAIIQGAAGVGKSVSLEVLNLAVEQDNRTTGKTRRAIGLAPSGAAGAELEKSAKIESGTAHSFLLKYENANTPEKRKELVKAGDYLVVDEAGMLDTRTLHKLSKVAAENKAKLVLVGDAFQLDAVGSASLFETLQDQTDKADIKQISRQKDPRLAAISQAFFDGAAGAGLNKMIDFPAEPDSRPLLHLADPEQVKEQIITRFKDLLESGESAAETLLLADKNADVLDLNLKARSVYADQGHITPEDSKTRPAALNGGEEYSLELTEGDRILLRQNAKIGDLETQVYNGDRATVISLDDSGKMTVELDRGEQVTLPADYLAVQYGYALTVHKSQGMTVNNALYLTSEGTDRRSAYVAFTRAREGGEFFVNNEEFSTLQKNTRDYNAKTTALAASGLLAGIAAEDLQTPATFTTQQPSVLELLEKSGPAIGQPAPATDQEPPATVYQPSPAARPEIPQPPEPPATASSPAATAERDLSHTIHNGFSSGVPALPLAGYSQPVAGVYKMPTGQPPEIKGVAGLYVKNDEHAAFTGANKQTRIYPDPAAAGAGGEDAICVAPATREPSPAALVALDNQIKKGTSAEFSGDSAATPELYKSSEIAAARHNKEFTQTPAALELEGLRGDLNELSSAAAQAAGYLVDFVVRGLADGAKIMVDFLENSSGPNLQDLTEQQAAMDGGDPTNPDDLAAAALPANKAMQKIIRERQKRARERQAAEAAFKQGSGGKKQRRGGQGMS